MKLIGSLRDYGINVGINMLLSILFPFPYSTPVSVFVYSLLGVYMINRSYRTSRLSSHISNKKLFLHQLRSYSIGAGIVFALSIFFPFGGLINFAVFTILPTLSRKRDSSRFQSTQEWNSNEIMQLNWKNNR